MAKSTRKKLNADAKNKSARAAPAALTENVDVKPEKKVTAKTSTPVDGPIVVTAKPVKSARALQLVRKPAPTRAVEEPADIDGLLRRLDALKKRHIELQRRFEASGEAYATRVRELEAQIAEQAKDIFVLNRSLIASSNYATRAVAATLPKAPAKILSSWVEDAKFFVQLVVRFSPSRAVRLFKAYMYLKETGRFDVDFYAAQATGVATTEAGYLRHYIIEGFQAGLDPTPDFSVRQYLKGSDDILRAGVEPYTHYLQVGRHEARPVARSRRAPVLAAGDAVMRGYVPRPEKDAGLIATSKLPPLPPEERDNHDWIMARRADGDYSSFGLYDFRPEDDVPVEGAVGEAFMTRFGLLGDAPDYAGAIEYLNGLTPKSRILVDDDTVPVDASIIIPIYGQLNYTLNCIHSLLLHESRYSFEILIGDDRSPDDSGIWLPKIDAIRYILHEQNGGFVINCNATAAKGRGDYMVMLNNDTRVVSGWLDWMVDAFTRFPKAGLVGSKLFYSDGSLQEAGAIIWKDASGWNYGRNDDPNRPRYCYARQVDFISGCSIAIPAALWKEMEGFDLLYKPAYCEDVDLAFRIQEAGYETWLQPLSRIIHYEGKTSGTDLTQGVKAYQVTNSKKLYERWKDKLSAHRDNAVEPWLEMNRKVTKRVLVIDATNPTPGQDAGSLATINLFRYYQALGYQVTFVPEDNFLYQRDEVRTMQAMGVECLYAPYDLPLTTIFRRYGALYDVVHVHRPSVAYKCLDLIRTYAPNARAVYQNADLHYLRMERQAVVEGRPELLEEAARMRDKELEITRTYDVTIVHSEAEKVILEKEVPEAKVFVMPLIENVVESDVPMAARKDLMFLGGYGHPPNVDAALWILDEIWPALSKALPESRLLLVGAKPPEAIRNRASDRVIVTGLVDELAPWFDRTRLFLAALRYGAGAKGKVLASLAHGVPVIATNIAAEGLPLVDGESVFVADTAKDIIDQTLKLYKQDELTWRKNSIDAKNYIEKHHGMQTCVNILSELLSFDKDIVEG